MNVGSIPFGRGIPYRLQLALSYGLFGLLFGGLLALDWQRIDARMDFIARGRGAALFSLIELARDWNASHQGVYVPITDATQPNPYLEHPDRDLTATNGMKLTLVNPAFMTRQISELAQLSEGIKLHITSLKPIRPANRAEPWEVEALQAFEHGSKEVVRLVEEGGAPVFRYMAPLHVKPACLHCHGAQGYEVGDVRGGISVMMPAESMLAVRDEQRWRAVLLHGAAFLLAGGLVHLLLLSDRRRLQAIERLTRAQDEVIAERTRELALTNASLAREVEERRSAQERLQQSELRHRAVFEHAAEGMFVTDHDARILQVNPAFTAITGYAPEEVVGQNPRLLASGRHDAAFYEVMWGALLRVGHWEGEIWNRRKDGGVYPEWLSIKRLGDEQDGYVAIFSDITRRKEAEAAMLHLAHHDTLTGLANRALFNARAHEALALARRHGNRFALLMVDLDLFKAVNDRLGHLAGDALLVEAGRRLLGCVRATDTVARLGGDEFALILQEVHVLDEAEQVAARVCDSLAQPFLLKEGDAKVSASVGIALYPDHASALEELQKNADDALYRAKRSGRDRHCVHVPPADGLAD